MKNMKVLLSVLLSASLVASTNGFVNLPVKAAETGESVNADVKVASTDIIPENTSSSQSNAEAEVNIVDLPIYEQSLLNYVGQIKLGKDETRDMVVSEDVYNKIIATKKDNKIIDKNTSFYTGDGEWAISLTAQNHVATLNTYCYKGPGVNMTYELPDTLTSYYVSEKNIENVQAVDENGKAYSYKEYHLRLESETDYITNVGTAFSGESNVSNSTNTTLNLILPKRVTTLSESAFKNNTKLVSLSFKGGIQLIGDKAFMGCTGLKTLDLTALFDHVTNNTIPKMCFYQCNSLENVTIPSSILNIGDFAFYQCDNIESMIIPRRIKSVGACAFGMCSELRYVCVQNEYQDVESVVCPNETFKLVTSVESPFVSMRYGSKPVGPYIYAPGTFRVNGSVDIDVNSVKITKDGEDVPFTEDICPDAYGYDTIGVLFKVTDKGTYTVTASDVLGNKSTTTIIYNSDVVDEIPPVVKLSGAGSKNGFYSNPTIYYADNETRVESALLDGNPIQNNYQVTENGEHTLVVTDATNNTTTVMFTVDNVAPTIAGIENNAITNKDVTLTFSDDASSVGKFYINEVEQPLLSKYTITKAGKYDIRIVDGAGNQKAVTFTLDKEKPIIQHVANNKYYNGPVLINASAISGIASITVAETNNDGSVKEYDVENGTVLTNDGTYSITVTNGLGVVNKYNFVIDTKAPTFNATDGKYYKVGQKITIADENLDQVLVNNEAVKETFEITDKVSKYVIIATDKAGNKLSAVIKRSKKNDAIVGVTNKGIYSGTVKVSYRNKNKVTRFSVDGKKVAIKAMKKGYKISGNGKHVVKMTVRVAIKKKKKVTYRKKVITTKFTIDDAVPTVDWQHNTENNIHTVSGIVADMHSGVAKVYLDNELLNGTTFSTSESGKHLVVVVDKAGNVAQYVFTI